MITTPPRSPRKVKKTITEITPEVKLQEPQRKKLYSRNNDIFGLWTTFRIIITVFMILGAFYLGIRIGFGDFEASIREYVPPVPADPMIAHCELMPNMKECENYNSGKTNDHTMNPMDMSMAEMGKMLEGKTGNELDKAFLEAMIPHHEGAVIMARYLSGAEHAELKKMGEAIIKAQNKEIEQMKKWQKEWGYISSGSVVGSGNINPTPAEKIAL